LYVLSESDSTFKRKWANLLKGSDAKLKGLTRETERQPVAKTRRTKAEPFKTGKPDEKKVEQRGRLSMPPPSGFFNLSIQYQ